MPTRSTTPEARVVFLPHLYKRNLTDELPQFRHKMTMIWTFTFFYTLKSRRNKNLEETPAAVSKRDTIVPPDDFFDDFKPKI
jgi:hypothetical protein